MDSHQTLEEVKHSMEKPVNASFEDGLVMCLDILEASENIEEARKQLITVLYAYKEVERGAKLEVIRDQLGIWP